MSLISFVVVRAIFMPDIPQQAAGLLMVVVPSLVALIVAFITGETYGDHSNRKHGEKNE